MKKKCMELSINMIVVLIMGVVLLTFGLYFLKTIMEKGNDLDQKVNEKIISELQKMMSHDGKKVSLLTNHDQIKKGEQKEFYLGVLNDLEEEQEFKINVTYKGTTVEDIDEEIKNDIIEGITYLKNPMKIPVQGYKAFKILIKAPTKAKTGEYYYDIQVCNRISQGGTGNPQTCGAGFEEYQKPVRIYLKIR